MAYIGYLFVFINKRILSDIKIKEFIFELSKLNPIN